MRKAVTAITAALMLLLCTVGIVQADSMSNAPGAGGFSPGGSNGQVQTNNAGSFGALGGTGVVNLSSGAPSVSTALPNGTTATTQAASSNDTKVATDAYVDTALSSLSATAKTPANLTAIVPGPVGVSSSLQTFGLVTPFTGTFSAFSSVALTHGNCVGICVGPDLNIWGVEDGGYFFKLTTAGALTETQITGDTFNVPDGMCAGPDGNLWTIKRRDLKVLRITTGGTQTAFSGLSGNNTGEQIIVGPDNNLWGTESGNNVFKCTTAGVITEYPVGASTINANSRGMNFVSAPDGNMYLVNNSTTLFKITTGGVVSSISLAHACNTIAIGPDGNPWAWGAAAGTGRFERYSLTTSTVTEYTYSPASADNGGPIFIMPDGAFWIFNAGQSKFQPAVFGGTAFYGRPDTSAIAGSPNYNSNEGNGVVGPDGNLYFAGGSSGKVFVVGITYTLGTSAVLSGSPTTTTQAANDNSTKISTTAYVDALHANIFQSADQTITAAGALTLAHGLGRTPQQVWIALVNQTGELGYTAGQVVYVNGNMDTTFAANTNAACSTIVDGTNLTVRYGSDAASFILPHATTGVATNITNGNWKCRFFAR